MLGHKDVSITLKVYTKFIEEDDEKRFKKIEKMGTILGTVSNYYPPLKAYIWGLEDENKSLL